MLGTVQREDRQVIPRIGGRGGVEVPERNRPTVITGREQVVGCRRPGYARKIGCEVRRDHGPGVGLVVVAFAPDGDGVLIVIECTATGGQEVAIGAPADANGLVKGEPARAQFQLRRLPRNDLGNCDIAVRCRNGERPAGRKRQQVRRTRSDFADI